MAKTTKAQFDLFCSEFMHWRERFGCQDIWCDFEHAPMDDAYADIMINYAGKHAVVRFNSKQSHFKLDDDGVKRTAKHEAIHLLISRLEDCAWRRHVSQNEIDSEVEALARRLEDLIV